MLLIYVSVHVICMRECGHTCPGTHVEVREQLQVLVLATHIACHEVILLFAVMDATQGGCLASF